MRSRCFLILPVLLIVGLTVVQGGDLPDHCSDQAYRNDEQDPSTCARVFEDANCNGRILLVTDTEEIGNLHDLKPKSTTWKNRISSAAIRLGCTLSLWQQTYMKPLRDVPDLVLTANSSASVLRYFGNNGFNDKAQSLTCYCSNSETCANVTEQWEDVMICSGTAASQCAYMYDVTVQKGSESITSKQDQYVAGVKTGFDWIFKEVFTWSAEASFNYDHTKTTTDDNWVSITTDQRYQVSMDRPANHTYVVKQRTKRCSTYAWKAPVIEVDDEPGTPAEFLASAYAAARLSPATLQQLRQMSERDDRNIALRPDADERRH